MAVDARPALTADQLAERRRIVEEGCIRARASVLAFAISRTHNQARAEDAVSETIIRAIKSSAHFEPGTNIDAWLFTICRNYIASEHRRAANRHDAGVPPEDLPEAALVAMSPAVNDSGTDVDKIVRCLACLPVDQRDALVAVGYAGLAYEEAAAVLKVAVGTIKSRANRGRVALLQMLEDVVEVQIPGAELAAIAESVPRGHPYYPIAQAYGLLFAEYAKSAPAKSGADAAWRDLVASGALDSMDYGEAGNAR